MRPLHSSSPAPDALHDMASKNGPLSASRQIRNIAPNIAPSRQNSFDVLYPLPR